MPSFRYRAAVQSGRTIEKTVIADSQTALKKKLENEGCFVLEIKRAGSASILPIAIGARSRLKEKDFYSFNQEFSVLIKSGISVVGSLDAIIEKGEKNEFNEILKEIREDIAGGESLSGAFGKYAHIFSNLYSSTLKAGEQSGNIASALSRYIAYMKKSAEVKKKVVSASTYPAILTAVSIFVLFFLIIYVVPSISGTFFEAGTELPWITTLLVNISNIIRSQFIYIVIFLIITASAYLYVRQTENARTYVDRLMLELPFFGELYIYYATSRLARTIAAVLESGTSLTESIRISSDIVNNTHIRQKLSQGLKMIEEGESFADSMMHVNVFPRLAVRMISAGESGGALDEVLNNIADFYDNEVDTRLSILTSAIEPALMIIMGLLIGLIVLALYLPIFQLAGTIG